MTNEQPNDVGRTYRCVTDGFSFDRIIDDEVADLPDRVEHLKDILEFLRGEAIPPTGVERQIAFRNTLGQDYPNPFNPTTTIG